MEGYQVSGQCQALVRDGVLLPTRDAPDLGYIRDSSDAQYVPDLYYKVRAPVLAIPFILYTGTRFVSLANPTICASTFPS
jgi:hypothetical protein